MFRGWVILATFLLSLPAYAQGTTGWAKKYEPLRQAISQEDLKKFTALIKVQKPKLYEMFFEKNPQFRQYRETACVLTNSSNLSWPMMGQGYYGLGITSKNSQLFEDYLLYAKVSYLNGIQEQLACALNYLGIGELYLFIQKPADAVMFLKEAAGLFHDPALKARYFTDLGVAYDLLGESSKAIEAFSEVPLEFRASLPYYYYLAHAYFVSGDVSKAKEVLQKANPLSKDMLKNSSVVPVSPQSLETLQKIIDQAAAKATSSI
jgi:tetratricopeptide (TPR) repeat protein